MVPHEIAVQQALVRVLDGDTDADGLEPVDVRNAAECHVRRATHAARLAIREAKAANLNQVQALRILMDLWRQP